MVLVDAPALPVVHAGILLRGDRTVNLLHGFYNLAYVVFFAQCLCRGTIAGRIGGKERSGTGTVDIVCGITERSYAGDIGTAASANDGVVDVFPEAGLV